MEFNRLFVENSYKEIYYEKAMHEKLNQIVHDKKAIEGDAWNIGNPQTGIYIIIPLTFPILQAFPPVH